MNITTKNRVLVVGDIHGQLKAFLQALERASFDPSSDTLISLGDIVDRGPDSYKVVEFLLSLKNLITIKGNHDDWFLEFLESGNAPYGWVEQGGFETLRSYAEELGFDIARKPSGISTDMKLTDIPQSHISFFKNQRNFYIDSDNRCFVHGGFDRHDTFDNIDASRPHSFYWDRDLWLSALSFKELKSAGYKFKMKENFTDVFIGHTSTINWKTTEPMFAANIINIDTGAMKPYGKITVMNVETKEYWQSEEVQRVE